MVVDDEVLKRALRALRTADDGLYVQSEGDVFVRSLEGDHYCAGLAGRDGIEHEIDFDDDLDGAIAYFIRERRARNHGSAW